MIHGRIVLLIIASTLGVASRAHAEPVLRPSAHGTFHVYEGLYAGGASAVMAAGYNIELEPLLLVPEVAASIGGFAGGFDGFGARALGGLRLGFAYLGSFEPSLVVRGGYGHLTLKRASFPDGALSPEPTKEVSHSGALQAGLSLEHRMSRDVTLGGEIVYDVFFQRRTPIALGASEGIVGVHTLAAGFTIGFWL
jgi:hypothetical protein